MNRVLSFDRYRFESATGRLWSESAEIRLTPKAAAVLGALVTRAQQPVTKEQLFATVWSGAVVGDDALTSCIQELRKALGDDAKQPRFIETRHRRGYRFIAPLSVETDASALEISSSARDLTAIAVLPFTDMSPGRDQDYLCDGLAEELINALTHIDGLRVAARSSSFQFRGPAVDVRAAGKQLGVDALLAGSVRKTDARLRITVQLVEVDTGFHRWSRRFDRQLEDVFAIEDEIAESVATSLRGADLSGREKQALQRPQTAIESYEYFLRGRQHLPRMRQGDLEQSIEMFTRAIDFDASYAPAWAGLAMAHATLFEWFGAKDDDLQGADRASRKALELAPNLADAHVARGCALALSREYDEAQQYFSEAIRINPHSFDAYYYCGRACFACGKVERSAEMFQKAAEARLEDFQSPILLEQSLRMLGRMQEARAAGREGVTRAERILALNPLDARALSIGSLALFEIGESARALEWSRRSLEHFPDDMSTLVNAACLASRAGLKEEALGFLERVFARGWGKKDWIEHDPDYDCLRDHPRFRSLFAKLK